MKNIGRDFLFSKDFDRDDIVNGSGYKYSDGSGYYHGTDGDGYKFSDGSGYFNGKDGSKLYKYSDGSGYFKDANGKYQYFDADDEENEDGWSFKDRNEDHSLAIQVGEALGAGLVGFFVRTVKASARAAAEEQYKEEKARQMEYERKQKLKKKKKQIKAQKKKQKQKLKGDKKNSRIKEFFGILFPTLLAMCLPIVILVVASQFYRG